MLTIFACAKGNEVCTVTRGGTGMRIALLILLFNSLAFAVDGLKPEAEDYYERLGLSPTASQAQVDARIKEVRKDIHTDRFTENKGLQTVMVHGAIPITEAISALESPKSRAAYDEKRRVGKAKEIPVSVGVLPRIEGAFPKEGMIHGSIKIEPGVEGGILSFSALSSALGPNAIPPFLSQTWFTAQMKISLAEYRRIESLAEKGEVSVREAKGALRRGQAIDESPKYLVDVSSGEPVLMVKPNAQSSFVESRKIAPPLPAVYDVKSQRYAYCPRGCRTPIPVNVLSWDREARKADVIEPKSLESQGATEFEVGKIAQGDLVWVEKQSDYDTLVKRAKQPTHWADGRVVSLPRAAGGDHDFLTHAFLSAREAHGVPTFRRSTRKEVCGDVARAAGQWIRGLVSWRR